MERMSHRGSTSSSCTNIPVTVVVLEVDGLATGLPSPALLPHALFV